MQEYQFEGTDEYYLDRELKNIVNIALAMEKPLLLTGEAGTGKTQLCLAGGQRAQDEKLYPPVQVHHQGRGSVSGTQDTVLRLNDARFGPAETGRIRGPVLRLRHLGTHRPGIPRRREGHVALRRD